MLRNDQILVFMWKIYQASLCPVQIIWSASCSSETVTGMLLFFEHVKSNLNSECRITWAFLLLSCYRSTGATKMNVDSSRSHALFTVTIECSEKIGDRCHITQGKLQLVDLAVGFYSLMFFYYSLQCIWCSCHQTKINDAIYSRGNIFVTLHPSVNFQ